MRAGYCHECERNVWLAEDGACQNGHPSSSVAGEYQVRAEVPTVAPKNGASARRVGVLLGIASVLLMTVGLLYGAFRLTGVGVLVGITSTYLLNSRLRHAAAALVVLGFGSIVVTAVIFSTIGARESGVLGLMSHNAFNLAPLGALLGVTTGLYANWRNQSS